MKYMKSICNYLHQLVSVVGLLHFICQRDKHQICFIVTKESFCWKCIRIVRFRPADVECGMKYLGRCISVTIVKHVFCNSPSGPVAFISFKRKHNVSQ